MYQVIVLPNALKDLSRTDKAVSKRVTDKLTWLSENIETITPVPLKGTFYAFLRLKVGDWRVIYKVNHDKKIITIHKVGHRREIYR